MNLQDRIVQVAHYPFQRASLERLLARHIGKTNQPCGFCDMSGRFVFRLQSDGLSQRSDRGWSRPLCSKGCYESYYGYQGD